MSKRGDKQVVTLWDVKTATLLDTLEGAPLRRFVYLAFSPDGKQLAASGEDKTIVVWDIDKRGVPKKE